MEKGTIVYSGASHDLKSQPEIVHRYLGRVPVAGLAHFRRGEYHETEKGYPAAASWRPRSRAATAGVASLTITKDLFAQASGPIVIGHHCDLTGVISSWGFWHDKCAKAAIELINKGGGIAGRKVELVTEDTESNPAPGARKLRNLIQRGNAEFIVGSVHSGVMLAALPIASELKTPYFSTGEATEVTGSKGTRFSFRTGTDTYSIAAASMPWCVENLGKVWSIIYADYAWGQSTKQESKLFIEKAGGKVLSQHPGAARHQGLRALPRADSRRFRGRAAGLHRLAVGRLLHPGQDHGPRQEDEDVLVVRQPRIDRSRRHPGRRRRRLLLRELPAHARAQERRVSTRSSTG